MNPVKIPNGVRYESNTISNKQQLLSANNIGKIN